MSAELMRTGASPEVRASHADRDRVVDVLTVAAGDGRLTAEELDERVEAALSTRTRGELAALTADLPTAADAAPAKDVVRIEQQGGSASRGDDWVVPRRMEIESAWGDVTLDFTRAVITHDTLRVDLDMRGGTLRLVTRPGVVVDTESLVLGYAEIKTRPAGEAGTPAVLCVEVRGRMTYGRAGSGERRGPENRPRGRVVGLAAQPLQHRSPRSPGRVPACRASASGVRPCPAGARARGPRRERAGRPPLGGRGRPAEPDVWPWPSCLPYGHGHGRSVRTAYRRKGPCTAGQSAGLG